MIASPKNLFVTVFTAVGLIAGAATAWVVQAKPEASMRVVKLERVVIEGKRPVTPAAVAQQQPIEKLPRVVIEARRTPAAADSTVLVAKAKVCNNPVQC
ncbi:hypothetical protein [Paucibacter sp. KCTC 42545]|uniref:hypothetical protein n=1 Tax=Paucibacter sp. KCTC 42545 TaxID=1768242 RepID=UPI000733B6AE|nr:hypothetical protein [Paucibacter sp. KCTC 42545]ALT78680.1 hypothetical protein AT984_17270 [Paucibacter sp. KCTC 42545]